MHHVGLRWYSIRGQQNESQVKYSSPCVHVAGTNEHSDYSSCAESYEQLLYEHDNGLGTSQLDEDMHIEDLFA